MTYLEEKLIEINSDEYQKEALDSRKSTVVIAGPGSGKTSVLTLKVMQLLDGYINEPYGLACITYSRETAREFEEKLERMGFVSRRNVFLGTVHSFCLSTIIEPFSNVFDLELPKDYRIASNAEIERILKETNNTTGIDASQADISRERMLGVDGVSKIKYSSNSNLRKAANCYESKLFAKGLIDFDSIIIASVKAIQKYSYIRECLNSRFSWLLIDEYQDLGHPLHEMVLSLFENTTIKIFAVGDVDQSIYSFSGAKPDYLQELSELNGIKVIHLVNNYRSNQDIIDGSELVLNKIRKYVAKTRDGEEARYEFYSLTNGYEEQFDFVASQLIPKYREEKIPYDEIAVLVANNKQCKDLSLVMQKYKIPYYISKHNFEITDFVKWLGNCAMYVSGVSNSLSKIFEFWLSLDFVTPFMVNDDAIIIQKKRVINVLNNSRMFSNCLPKWLAYVVREFGLDKSLDNSLRYPDELKNLRILYKELNSESYKTYDLSMFGKIGKPKGQVSISTRHSSKGLEFEAVILCGMEEGHFPAWYNRNDEEKRNEEDRLCFVCVSRAKRICSLIYSTNYVEGKNPTLRIYGPSKYYRCLFNEYGKKE